MKKRIAALLFAGILALAPAGGTAFNPTGGGIWQTVSAVEPRIAPATLVVCGTVNGDRLAANRERLVLPRAEDRADGR